MQLAKAREDAQLARERGRALYQMGVLESDISLLFGGKTIAGNKFTGVHHHHACLKVLNCIL